MTYRTVEDKNQKYQMPPGLAPGGIWLYTNFRVAQLLYTELKHSDWLLKPIKLLNFSVATLNFVRNSGSK